MTKARTTGRLAGLLTTSSATLGILLCATTGARAEVSWKNIQFGGFVSQGYMVNTGQNDYLGDTSAGTFDFREFAANTSYSIGKWRVGAQVFGQRLGDYGHDKVGLDWASVDYQACSWFGLRAGRVKTPRGLYNEALDVDSVRPYVLLPQGVYDARLRDFNSSFDGVMAYGNVSLKKAGSLDYRAYVGDIHIATDSGASDYFNNDVPLANADIGMNNTIGGSLFWNTPIQGLRTGYSFTRYRHFTAGRILSSGGTAPAGTAPVDGAGDGGTPPDGEIPADGGGGQPSSGSGIIDRGTKNFDRHLVSAEYITGDWTFAAEAGRDHAFYSLINRGETGMVSYQTFKSDNAYVSVSRRLGTRFELGSYYSYSLEACTGNVSYRYKQKDHALSLRYDVNEHVIVKAEVHYMDGHGKLFNTASRPQALTDRDGNWTLFTVKTTLSF